MESTIIVCEKPDACMHIAHALAERELRVRRSKYGIDYYEFERNGRKHVAVTAVGHLFNLKQKNRGLEYPIFDAIWQACGSAFSPNYNEEGDWEPRQR